MNQTGKCESCDALLRSGDYDWVLAEITQSCEWRPRQAGETLAARHYRENADPGFSIQHLEDRTSVIFWRSAMADRLGDVKPLLKVATESVCKPRAVAYKRDAADGQRTYFGACSVGSVELHGIVQGEDRDYGLVEVRWSAHRHRVAQDGKVHDLGQWQRHRSLYVLLRLSDVKTNIQRSIDSAHCPACGAPESELASHACEFCESVLNTGGHDWVLVETHQRQTREAQTWLTKLKPRAAPAPTPAGTATFSPEGGRESPHLSQADGLAWMIVTLAADGKIQKSELQVVAQLSRKLRLPKPMVEGLIRAGMAGELDAPVPPDGETCRRWLELMADVTLADGAVQPSEQEILERLGSVQGYSRADIQLLVNKRRAFRRQMVKT